MEPTQAGAGAASAPMCSRHQEPHSGACARCGVFTCLLCPGAGELCEQCKEQELIRSSARRLVSGPALLIMMLSALGLVLSGVWLVSVVMEPKASSWDLSHSLPFLGCGVSSLALAGGIQMRRLRNYPLAINSSVVAMVVLFPLAGLGLIVGGAALWTLSRASVRAGFRLQDGK